MNDKLPIKINILGREYPLKINRGDAFEEEMIRKAAVLINDKIQEVKNQGFKVIGNRKVDNQDFLAIVSLKLVIQNLENQLKEDVSPLIKEIKHINYSLEETINKK